MEPMLASLGGLACLGLVAPGSDAARYVPSCCGSEREVRVVREMERKKRAG